VDLFEYQGKQYFARYDIPVSPGGVAVTVDEAVAQADAAGYPVVIKADGLAAGKELSCSMAPQGHEDAALPPALAAKTTHDLFQRLLERLGLAPQVDGSTAASLGETFDERKSFFAPSTAWWRQ